MDSRVIDIILRARDQASGAFNSAAGGVSKLGAAVGAYGQSVMTGAAVAGTAAGVAITAMGFKAVQSAGQFEQSRVAFDVMLGSGERAQALLRQISDFAAKTPFELPEVVAASKQLLAFGFAQEQIIPTMRKLGDIAAGVGVPVGQLTNVFGQVRVAGRLMGQDLLQFTNAGVPLIETLAQVMGKPQTEIKKLVEEGKVGFPEVEAAINKLTDSGSKFGGLMERQSGTLGGILSNLSDSFGRVLRSIVGVDDAGNIMAGGAFDRIKNQAAQIGPALEKVGYALGGVAAIFISRDFNGDFWGKLGIAEDDPVINTLFTVRDAIAGIAGAIGDFVSRHGDFFRQFAFTAALVAPAIIAIGTTMAILSSPIGALMTAIIGVSLAITAISRASTPVKAILAGVAGAVVGLGIAIMTVLVPAWIAQAAAAWAAIAPLLIMAAPFIAVGAAIGAAAFLIIKYWDEIKSAASSLWQWLQEVWDGIASFLSNNWAFILAAVMPIVGIPVLIYQHWGQITAWFASVWASITQAFASGVTAVVNWFSQLPYNVGLAIGTVIRFFWDLYTVHIPAFVMGVLGWLGQLPGRIWGIMQSVASFMWNAWVNMHHQAINTAINLVNSVGAWIGSLPGRIAGALSNLWGAASGAFNNLKNNAVNMARNAVEEIINWFRRLPGEIGGIVSGAIGDAKNKVGDFFAGIGRGITGRQVGGPVQAGRAVMVGEGGRELFIPNQSGRIVRNAETEAAMAAGGGGLQLHLEVNVGMYAGLPVEKQELALGIWEEITRAARAQGVELPALVGGRP